MPTKTEAELIIRELAGIRKELADLRALLIAMWTDPMPAKTAPKNEAATDAESPRR